MPSSFACPACQTLVLAQGATDPPRMGYCESCHRIALEIVEGLKAAFEVEYEVEQREVASSEGHVVWCGYERGMTTEAEANETARELAERKGERTRVVRSMRLVIREFEGKGCEEVKGG